MSLKPQPLIARERIAKEVKRLAQEINRDYQGKQPLLLGILKGSFIFMADLVRLLEIPVEIDFVRLSSYGSAKVSPGKVRMAHGPSTSIRGKDVLVIDDIADTGNALSFLVRYLRRHGPSSVKLCALLDKPSRRETEIHVDYIGLTVPDEFVVGYGLDYDDDYRQLPDIHVVED